VTPAGCDQGIGLSEITPVAGRLLNEAVHPLYLERKIRATFTGTLAQYDPDGYLYFHDNGVRLNVTRVTDLKISKP
jgi:hypothetical protein